jgi:multiple sugar transport system permease protein
VARSSVGGIEGGTVSIRPRGTASGLPPGRLTGVAKSRRRRETLTGYLFIGPATVFFIVFLGGPLLAALIFSFTDWQLLGPIHFIGVSNYKSLFSAQILQIFENTFYFTFGSIVLHIVPGFLLAALVVRLRSKTLKYIIQTMYVAPFLLGYASAALLWEYMLNASFGPVPYYLGKLGLTMPFAGLLNSPAWAMPALLGVDEWATFGFLFLVLLAGIQQIPNELYEAASLDGAGPLRQMFRITIPLSAPTIFYAIVVNFILAFQIFTPMYIMTNGGPLGRTESMVQYIYQKAFQSFQIGPASTLAVASFLIIALLTVFQFTIGMRVVRRATGYPEARRK